MKLNDIYEAIEELVLSLPDVFDGVEIAFPKKDKSKPIGDWTDQNDIGIVVTGDGIGSNSGVYFFAKPNCDVFYIGKAANLHGRVWDHVNTPGPIVSGKRKFPNQRFRVEGADEEIDTVKSGTALLGLATISDPNLSALIEVYLHTLHIKRYGKLPALNKQVG